MPLTDAEVRAAVPKEKEWKLFDGEGLYLLIHPKGGRYWKLKYRFAGKEDKCSFGVYPKVGLKAARLLRNKAKQYLDEGKDPKIEMQREKNDGLKLFEDIAKEWLATLENPDTEEADDEGAEKPKGSKDSRNDESEIQKKKPLAPKTIAKKKFWLEEYVYPFIGRRLPDQVEPPEILSLLRRIEKRGFNETTHRVYWMINKIYRFAKASSYCKSNPSSDLSEALVPVVTTNHAAIIDPVAVGGLLRAIDDYNGEPVTQLLLRLLPYVFLRNSEIRCGQWSEINFQAKEWRVPGPRMKMPDYHIVPLPDQAIEILKKLHQLTGHRRLMFPGQRSKDRPISNNTVNAALRRMGYSTVDQMTGHGFRTVADTFLNELGWNADAIELQLAHKERKKTRRVYNKAQKLAERRKMMQAYADYLDTLRAGGNVVSIFAKSA
ncbi:MAG TPA: integrase arm-type DNA-binding domain-containing protein [Steroidobacter sp.]|uniref:tyrosine-type recombinase/integrase n=1 Tax=Steroidobacter sp. TaxID=1978227 RepID=UPI002ED7D883